MIIKEQKGGKRVPKRYRRWAESGGDGGDGLTEMMWWRWSFCKPK